MMQLDQLYQEIILDHYRSPHHHGLREPFDAEVHQVNPTCGDEVTLRVSMGDPAAGEPGAPGVTGTHGAIVRDMSYESLGCSISQAAASVLADTVIGRPVGEALARVGAFEAMVTSRGTDRGDEELLGDGVAFAGVAKYPNRVKCALMSWLAFRLAVDEAVGRAGQPAGDDVMTVTHDAVRSGR
jgi:nitrogen fixation NifU-like protein